MPGLAFGVSLERLAEFDNASDADEDYVPSVVKQIIEHLQQNGKKIEILRILAPKQDRFS